MAAMAQELSGQCTFRDVLTERGKISITPVKRATFVINPDRTIRTVIKSEVNMNTHADKALEALRG